MTKSRIVLMAVLLSLVSSTSLGAGAAADISALAWMAGNWTGTQDGLEMEELWQKPKGNTMLGVHRDVKAAARSLSSSSELKPRTTSPRIGPAHAPGRQRRSR